MGSPGVTLPPRDGRQGLLLLYLAREGSVTAQDCADHFEIDSK